MAELVDARDLKSLDQKSCGFDSRLAHQNCKGKFNRKGNKVNECISNCAYSYCGFIGCDNYVRYRFI